MYVRFLAVTLAAAAVVGLAAPPSWASPLYTLDANGSFPGNFLRVDPATGASVSVNPMVSLGLGSWNGLTALPGNDRFVYASHNPRPRLFEDPQFSRIARINVADGTSTLFPLFDPDVIGVPEVFSTGIAISPLEPSIAVVTGFQNRVFNRLIWKVHLATGAVMGPAVELQDGILLQALTYSLDGTTLYGANDDEQLVTIDPDTGAVQVIGDMGLTSPVTGLAFRPEDNSLFAIEAGFIDRLVTLNPLDGSLKSVIGSMDNAGPEGLAFVPCSFDLPGDTNHDCVVDAADLNNVRNHFGATGMPVLGDANGDGIVDVKDLNEVRNHFGATAAAAVPEPATALLTLCGTCWLAFFCRGRRGFD